MEQCFVFFQHKEFLSELDDGEIIPCTKFSFIQNGLELIPDVNAIKQEYLFCCINVSEISLIITMNSLLVV